MPAHNLEIVFGKPQLTSPRGYDGVRVSFPVVVNLPAINTGESRPIKQGTITVEFSEALAKQWDLSGYEQTEQAEKGIIPLLFKIVCTRLPQIVNQLLEQGSVTIPLGTETAEPRNPYPVAQLCEVDEVEGHVEKIAIELDDTEPEKGPPGSSNGSA